MVKRLTILFIMSISVWAWMATSTRLTNFNLFTNFTVSGNTYAQLKSKKPHALPTGTNIRPPIGLGGLCEFTVDNTNKDVDAVVKLVSTANRVLARYVYIQRGRSFTMTNIEPGTYTCYVQTGLDWNPSKNEFKRNAQYLKFERHLLFQQFETGNSIQYSTIRVTLYKVLGGNTRTNPVSKKEFDRAESK